MKWMPDMEKAIKGLECCSEKQNCKECPYFCFNAKCQDDMNRDAIALLKEQEDKKEYCNNCAESAIKTTVELQEEIARLRSLLKEQEAVVRCISCTFYRSNGECALHNGRWKPEGFCSWAIRKEGR